MLCFLLMSELCPYFSVPLEGVQTRGMVSRRRDDQRRDFGRIGQPLSMESPIERLNAFLPKHIPLALVSLCMEGDLGPREHVFL